MTKKTIAFSLAGLLAAQAVSMNHAYAGNSRVDDIGNEQVQQAKQNLVVLKSQLVALDEALLAARTQIEKRNSQGTILSGASVTGAAIGLGFTAYSMLTLTRRGADGAAGMEILLSGTVSLLASAVSAGFGTGAIMVKDDENTQQLRNQVEALANQGAEAMATIENVEQRRILQTMVSNLSSLKTQLDTYSGDESFDKSTKMASTLAQAVGAGMLLASATRRNTGTLTAVGALVMASGNLGQVLIRLNKSEADMTIKEIDRLREAIRISANGI